MRGEIYEAPAAGTHRRGRRPAARPRREVRVLVRVLVRLVEEQHRGRAVYRRQQAEQPRVLPETGGQIFTGKYACTWPAYQHSN